MHKYFDGQNSRAGGKKGKNSPLVGYVSVCGKFYGAGQGDRHEVVHRIRFDPYNIRNGWNGGL